MSRTFGLTAPCRRSRRLLENGYYQVDPGDVLNLLDGSTSEEDDNSSVYSSFHNLSFSGEQRCIGYKESPPRPQFNCRRRSRSRSPMPGPSKSKGLTSQQAMTESKTVQVNSGKNFQKHNRQGSASSLSTSNIHSHVSDERMVVGSISSSIVDSNRQQHNHSHSFEMQRELRSGRTYQIFAAGEHSQLPLHASTPKPKTSLHSLTCDKTTMGTLPTQRSDSIESIQEKTDGESSQFLSLHEDENKMKNYCILQVLWCHCRELMKVSMILFNFFCVLASYLVRLIRETGKFYQAMNKKLVFDLSFLSNFLPFNPWCKKSLTLFVFSGTILLLLQLVSVNEIWSLSTMHRSSESSTIPLGRSDDGIPSTPDVRQLEAIDQTLHRLELLVEGTELKMADRYSTLLLHVENSEAVHKKDVAKLSKNQQDVLAVVQNMIDKSIAIQLLKSNDLFQSELQGMKTELAYVHNNHSRVNKQLKQDVDDKVEQNERKFSYVQSKLKDFDKALTKLNKNVENLGQDHSAFRTSFEKQAGNLTFLREISNDQFIHNFLLLLHEGKAKPDEKSVTKHRRYYHLSMLFIEWLAKRGFLQQTDLNKIMEEILKNSTDIPVQFEAEVGTSAGWLKTFNAGLPKPLRKYGNAIAKEQLSDSPINERLVKIWIQEALNLYSADRIGLPDFASELTGASIVLSRCSESYRHKTAVFSVLGIPIYYDINTPRSIIQPGVMPGECWVFKGSQGYVVISLSSAVRPTAFTVDHIPKSVALFNDISSAPKDFTVYGLKHGSDVSGVMLGNFRYEEDGDPIQHFVIQKSYRIIEKFPFIELKVHSNWGHPKFTCLYRFRVHGEKMEIQ